MHINSVPSVAKSHNRWEQGSLQDSDQSCLHRQEKDSPHEFPVHLEVMTRPDYNTDAKDQTV